MTESRIRSTDFSSFMAQNKLKRENVKFVASKLFVDSQGEPLKWEIKAITSKEDDALRKSCTRAVKVGKGAVRPELDTNAYIGKLAAACTVYPDLKNAELQTSYGVMGDDELLKEMLSAGEYAEYCNKVSEINGFDVDLNDAVDDAKN